MLVGREFEQAHLDGLLSRARNGDAGALLLTGEAGIGKTSLLSSAAGRATGMRVLSATGFEADADLAFTGLGDLLRPVLHLLPAIPAPQLAALSGALRITAPVAGDRFTVYAGVLSLLAAAAEESPLLITVDDAHWLDGASLEAVLFVARRLRAEPIAVVVVVRDTAAIPFSVEGMPRLPLGGLTAAACHQLLGPGLRPDVAARLSAACGGNPLALQELSQLLSPAQRHGLEQLGDPLPAGPLVRQAFLRRLAGLPGPTRQALLTAATSATGDLREVGPALVADGACLQDLEPAESAGLVVLERGRVHFRHPLLRSTVYSAATPAQRRLTHAALAASLVGQGQLSRRAWHLAEATAAQDGDVARMLEQAAVDARRHGAPAAAAAALERAAQLTPDADAQARRLREAAGDWLVVGRGEHAEALLEQALGTGAGARERAHAVQARGWLRSWAGHTLEASGVLEAEARRLLPDRPREAARLFAAATIALVMNGNVTDAVPLASEARRACAALPGEMPVEVNDCVIGTFVLAGRADEVRPLIEASERVLLEADGLAYARWPAFTVAQALMWVDEFERASALLDRSVAAARAASAPGLLAYPLAIVGQLARRTGRWAAASAAGHEAVTIADEVGQPGDRVITRVMLAALEAAQGEDRDCRRHLDAVFEMLEGRQLEAARTFALAALGHLALGAGAIGPAITHLEEVRALVGRHGVEEATVVQWAPDLVEAYVRAGRHDDADAALVVLEEQAERDGRVSALAAAARGRATLATRQEHDELFGRALALHATLPTPFERARTELLYGECLRRGRRPAEARVQLLAALRTFESLGAKAWASRSAAELAAAGGPARPRSRNPSRLRLTPQELQVALVVGQGATSREAAAALFLSPRTVDFHLGNAFRKLGARSRAELVRLVATGREPFDQGPPRAPHP